MNLEALRAYLFTKKGTTEETPFGPDALVFKVGGKMFGLVAWQESPLRITLKADPDLASTLRGQYQAVQPGYYMNKKHWNTVTLDGTIPEGVILAMIDESYRLVVKGLTQTVRRQLEAEEG
jgi:predicted DNA-binding protein (MmcQ/YjbR family)